MGFKASAGFDATKRRVLGDPGEDLLLPVPPGVTVTDDDGKLIGEINKAGEKLKVAVGAPGGSPRNEYVGRRADQKYGEKMRVGEEITVNDDENMGWVDAGEGIAVSFLAERNYDKKIG